MNAGFSVARPLRVITAMMTNVLDEHHRDVRRAAEPEDAEEYRHQQQARTSTARRSTDRSRRRRGGSARSAVPTGTPAATARPTDHEYREAVAQARENFAAQDHPPERLRNRACRRHEWQRDHAARDLPGHGADEERRQRGPRPPRHQRHVRRRRGPTAPVASACSQELQSSPQVRLQGHDHVRFDRSPERGRGTETVTDSTILVRDADSSPIPIS